MVRLPEGYCIDSTEVTWTQYSAWLSTNPTTAGQISDCTWNTAFTPDTRCMDTSAPMCKSDNCPQTCVDWCDAYAYCQAAGKRLCGKIGGGSLGFGDYANASLSQWYNACTSHGVNTFPYGTTYEARACHAPVGCSTCSPGHVGELSTCQSGVTGYSGVYDLSGNVEEWEDSCDGAGQLAQCRTRGGDASNPGFSDGVSCAADTKLQRDYVIWDNVGLRCCAP
jgi:formylglycine-generating enzyme required for sulfatase activity